MSAHSDNFFASMKFKNIMKYVYGLGAAIVILGALFKIMHWPGADIMLIFGLSTEAVIFILSVMEPLHIEKEWDWALVYPQLEVGDSGDIEDLESNLISNNAKPALNTGVSQQLDEMLSEAKIGPELIESLGQGFRSLSNQTSKLADITSVSDDFTNNLKSASNNVANLSESYAKAASSLSDIGISPEDGKGYGEQMRKITENLTQLNSMYELQLKETTDNLNAASKMSEGVSGLMKNLSDSVQDTQRYRENISELSSNLSALNTIYGNMLNAMNFNRG